MSDVAISTAPPRAHWSARLVKRLRAAGAWPLPPWLHDAIFLRESAYWPFVESQILKAVPPDHAVRKPGALNVLLIDHCFEQDIAAMLAANRQHRVMTLRYQEIRELARMIFPRRVLTGMAAYGEPGLEPLRALYRQKLEHLVDLIYAAFPVDVVLAPSDVFFWIREFIPAMQARGALFINLDKEGSISPLYFERHADDIRRYAPPISDAILVWSERQRRFWQRAGADESRIHVVGQPRSDFWHADRWPARSELGLPLREDAPLVLFFSFERSAYILPELYARRAVRWDRLFDEAHRGIFEFARRHPAADVVIKAHPQQDRIDDLQRDIARQRLSNLHLAVGAALANPLIAHADVVAGFQTTALIEALIPGSFNKLAKPKPVIYLFWDAAPGWSSNLLPLHQFRGLTVARSPAAFQSALVTALRWPRVGEEMLRARRHDVQQWLHQPDGQVCQRTWAVIEKLVAAKRGVLTPWIAPLPHTAAELVGQAC